MPGARCSALLLCCTAVCATLLRPQRDPLDFRIADSTSSLGTEQGMQYPPEAFVDTVLAELEPELSPPASSSIPRRRRDGASSPGSDLVDFNASLLEMRSTAGVGKVHAYCEICIRILQMYQRGLPDVCAGLTDTFFITCVKNLESILKADRAVTYWHRTGCVHNDDGPEVVRPCPAHAVCGWVPNIFSRRTGVTQLVGQLAPLCPRDVNFLPRVPRTLAPGGLPGT